jgi:hypothetical protein
MERLNDGDDEEEEENKYKKEEEEKAIAPFRVRCFRYLCVNNNNGKHARQRLSYSSLPSTTMTEAAWWSSYYGALEECEYYDREKYPRRVVLASTVPRAMTYWLFPNAESARRCVQASLDTCWFRYIEDNDSLATYAYFDMDRPYGEGGFAKRIAKQDEQFRAAREQFIQAAKLAVAYFQCFVDALFTGRTRVVAPSSYHGEWHFYDASTPEKLSMHAHSTMRFASVKELGSVVTRFVDMLRALHERNDPLVAPLFFYNTEKKRHRWACIIDTSVYTSRPFRLPYQRKDCSRHNYLMPLCPLESVDADLKMAFVHDDEMYKVSDCRRYCVPSLQRVQAYRKHAYHLLIELLNDVTRNAPRTYMQALDTCSTFVHQIVVCAQQHLVDNATTTTTVKYHAQRLDSEDAIHALRIVFLENATQCRSKGAMHWLCAVVHLVERTVHFELLPSMVLSLNQWDAQRTLLGRAYAETIAHVGDTRHRLASMALIYLCMRLEFSTTAEECDDAHSMRVGDFFSEYVFCAFFVRATLYYRTLLLRNDVTTTTTFTFEKFLRYQTMTLPSLSYSWDKAHDMLAWIRRSALRLFAVPEAALTIESMTLRPPDTADSLMCCCNSSIDSETLRSEIERLPDGLSSIMHCAW